MPIDPNDPAQMAAALGAGSYARVRPARYVPDLSGYRYMPGVFCPRCRGNATRKFHVPPGSFVAYHYIGCEAKCGFAGLIKGRVVPETEADGKTMTETPAAAFQKLLDQMHAEKLTEINLLPESR
jgi:hypothetical protein